MRPSLSTLFILLYLLISSAPVIVTFFDHPPPPQAFSIEYSAAIGYIALCLLILQFALTERIKVIEKQFGADILIQFHKKMGVLITLLIVIHPVIIFVHNPARLRILKPSHMPIQTVFALISFASLLLLGLLSLFRTKWKLSYEFWRVTHGFLAIIVLYLGLLHALKFDRYLGLFWKKVFWDALVLYVVLHLLHSRILKPLLVLAKPWKVIQVSPEKGNCWRIDLEAVNHKGLKFKPGQFAYLRLKSSPIWFHEHPFTISSGSSTPTKVSFTIKELGDFTSQISKVQVGQDAYIDGPYGVFSYKNFPKGERLWMVAGGVGITPMLSMLQTLESEGDQREITLMYAASKPSKLTYYEEIEKMKSSLNLRTVYVLEEPSDPLLDAEQGYITKEVIAKYLDQDKETAQFFLCGPPVFNRSVFKELRELGISNSNIHSELFQLG